jgi:hypothetical protein
MTASSLGRPSDNAQATIVCGWPCAAPADHADAPGGFARCAQEIERPRLVGLADDDDHADAAVEDTVHLGVRHLALLLQPVEQLRPLPGRAVQRRHQRLAEDARHVVEQPAAGDVGEALHGRAFMSASSGLT